MQLTDEICVVRIIVSFIPSIREQVTLINNEFKLWIFHTKNYLHLHILNKYTKWTK